MRYPCLVLDHDDTVVDSTATVHYPCFVEYCGIYHPEVHYTLEEYIRYNFEPGIVALFGDMIGMSREEMEREQRYWNAYVKRHVPRAYGGMRELLLRHREQGGALCVVSHSYTENILRDYRENGLPEPDLVFGWESPSQERKPNPYPLEQIMKRLGFVPEELLVLDDLKPGYDMAKSCGVSFAAAGWGYDIPEIESFMRANCDEYFKTVAELSGFLFDEER